MPLTLDHLPPEVKSVSVGPDDRRPPGSSSNATTLKSSCVRIARLWRSSLAHTARAALRRGVYVGIACTHDHATPGSHRSFSPELIGSIRAAIRLEDVIGERIPLRRSGRVLVGRCPWHDSKSGRSFVVYPGQQTWRCWGCAVGGDVFSFFMRFAGISFPSAVKLVANIVGVEIDGHPAEGLREQLSTRTELGQVEKQI